MASALESEIIRVLTETRDQIRANMQARNINASGRTSESLRVEVQDDGIALLGGYNTKHPVEDYPAIMGTAEASDTAPIPTLEVGRAGGGSPPVPRGFYYIIRQWSRDKGLSFASESERSTFAYFLSRKIARQGTKRNIENEDIYSTAVMQAKDKIYNVIRASVSNTVRAALGQAKITSLKGAFTQ